MSELNYEKDLSIDETALDVEWLEHPMLLMRYAKKQAEARRELDLAKNQLDLVRARLDNEIRSEPEKFEIKKITEAVVTNAILVQDDYQAAMKEVIKARYEDQLLSSAVKAMDQRKSALENMVKLHGMQYFAGPLEPRDLSKEVAKKHTSKTSNDKVKGAMTRRSKK